MTVLFVKMLKISGPHGGETTTLLRVVQFVDLRSVLNSILFVNAMVRFVRVSVVLPKPWPIDATFGFVALTLLNVVASRLEP